MSDCQKAKNRRTKVRNLQRTLYLKSKQDKRVRFHSLYDKIYREDILWEAWWQVKVNKGAPGVDEESINEIIEQKKEGEMIKMLQKQLQDKKYKFSPVRIVKIPKPKGGIRKLGIATVKDRVVQTALKIVIEPIFEAGFHECSYGYRPKRNAKQASEAIRKDLYNRAWGVVELDFKSFFDTIPHKNLLILVRKKIVDGSVLRLISQTIKVGVYDKGNIVPTKVGVPQGSPLSPLYSNIYLNLIDQLWHKREYPQKLQATIHRYCDDAILICRRSAISALGAFVAISKRMGLTINQEKTQITKLKDGFDFIGYHFVKRKSNMSGKSVIYIFPTGNSQKKIRNTLKYITSRRAPIKPEEFIERIKPVVRGWTNYYCHTNVSEAFRKLQSFINARFRRYLNYRSKGRGFGWKKFPNSKLYAIGMIYIGRGLIEYPSKTANDLR